MTIETETETVLRRALALIDRLRAEVEDEQVRLQYLREAVEYDLMYRNDTTRMVIEASLAGLDNGEWRDHTRPIMEGKSDG